MGRLRCSKLLLHVAQGGGTLGHAGLEARRDLGVLGLQRVNQMLLLVQQVPRLRRSREALLAQSPYRALGSRDRRILGLQLAPQRRGLLQ